MSSANLTMIGIYNFDSTIFDGLLFPAGINKDTAVNEILSRCGEFEILYPNISFLKQMITHWGNKHYRTFDKWIKALELEFDPLYNYDRYEEYEDTKNANGNVFSKSNMADHNINNVTENENSTDRSNSASQTATNSTSSDTNTRSVSAYDSSVYQPREQEIKSNTSGQTGNGAAQNENIGESRKTADSVSNSATNSESDTTSKNDETIKHKAHLYGNIGVTTSTQMLEDYIRVERFNIYEQIADIFVDEFCLMVY